MIFTNLTSIGSSMMLLPTDNLDYLQWDFFCGGTLRRGGLFENLANLLDMHGANFKLGFCLPF